MILAVHRHVLDCLNNEAIANTQSSGSCGEWQVNIFEALSLFEE